ncbi:DUF6804 family protein [Aquimarina sp. 2201CG1-2-11]|uniref:DUF6804 family protein n=1 Tax=Aquimarina discodermiae TaxID=3231043 RepID=UPI0034637FD4
MISKYCSLICACCLGIAILNLPMPYYTFLRFVVALGAMLIIIKRSIQKEYLWMGVFIVIAILFNPFISIYLHQKSKWIWVDILVALLFLIDFYPHKSKQKTLPAKQTTRKYSRDKIY